MSWSARFRVDSSNVEEPFTKIDAFGLDTDEHKRQHDEALLAATQVLINGAVGSPNKTYMLTLSGHGNPNHEPVNGWSNDFVSITVTQE